jgi:hypothetical protein
MGKEKEIKKRKKEKIDREAKNPKGKIKKIWID